MKGFTLIEVLVASAIFALVAVAGISSFTAIARSTSQQKIILETETGVEQAMDSITRSIKTADSIITYSPKLTITLPTDKSTHTYKLEDNILKDGTAPITGNKIQITSFVVSQSQEVLAKPLVDISITAQSVDLLSNGKPYEFKLTTSVTPRNWSKYD